MPSAIHEAAFDRGLVGTVAHERRIGATADEQVDGLDQECLARARLARDRGQALAEHQVEVGDDPEIDDVQLDEHRRATGRPGRTWPSGSGGSRVAEGHDAERVGGRRARHAVTGRELAELEPVERSR